MKRLEIAGAEIMRIAIQQNYFNTIIFLTLVKSAVSNL